MTISSSSSIACGELRWAAKWRLRQLEAGVEVALVGGDGSGEHAPRASRGRPPPSPPASGRRRPRRWSSIDGLLATGSKALRCIGDAAGVEQRRAGSRSARCRWPGWWRAPPAAGRARCVAVASASSSSAAWHLVLGGLLVGARHVLVEELRAPRPPGRAPTKPSTGWPPLNRHAERDAAHAEHLRQLLRDLRLVVGVELDQLEAAGVGRSRAFPASGRASCTGRTTAPRCRAAPAARARR